MSKRFVQKLRAEVFYTKLGWSQAKWICRTELGSLSLEEYVDLRWLEITCGEAPYMVTRYDTVTGEEIPLSEASWFC